MMSKKLQLFCLALLGSLLIKAQAPAAGFSLAGQPCINGSFVPTNTSAGSATLTFGWSIFPSTSTILPTASATSPTITLGPGNYTITLVATNSLGTSSYSQAINGVTTCPVCLDTIRIIKNIDTLKTYAAANNSLILGCQTGFAGFLTGTNCYKEKEFAQYYAPSSYSNTPIPQVNSVIVLFDSLGTKAGSSAAGVPIYCKLYGGTIGAGPNSLITQVSDLLGNIAGSTNKTVTIQYCGTKTYTFTTTKIIPFKFNFGGAIIPTSGFFAAVETPYNSPLDSIRIFSNTKYNTTNDSSAWLLQYTNNWRTFRYNKNTKIQLGILPIISCRPIAGIEVHTTDFNSNITVMPNPSNGQFSLIFTLSKQEDVTVRIINPLGQQISSDKVQNVSNNVLNIDLRNRPAGIYFIEIANGNEKVVKKIILNN
ncbi:MAG: T9SS type A sorting domain-containing protein [Bacteroidetes bacterium]|nr:T9SS type A sorting domain-containing protein [Bacteroidota bacterium]